MILTNKHVVIAMIVAPILAILAYYAVDAFVSEAPHQAAPGSVYKLVAKPTCRYESGLCELRNNDIELSVTGEFVGSSLHLTVTGNLPLEGVQLAIGSKESGEMAFSRPVDMQPSGDGRQVWKLTSGPLNHTQAGFRLVAYIQSSAYFAEFPALFLINTTTPS